MKPKTCAHCKGQFLSSPTPNYCASCYRTAITGQNCYACHKPITKARCGIREGQVVWDGSSQASPRRLSGIKEDLEQKVVEYATEEALACAVLRWTERDLNVNGPVDREHTQDPFTGKPRERMRGNEKG